MQFRNIISLKGEFEAEGLSRDTVAAEAAFAARNGLGYLVKIGGCEAKADMRYLIQIGIRSIVAPMIESPFAMKKYQEMLPEGAFEHVGVTIETVDAVRRIDEILDAGINLTEVTVGRTDLTASCGGSSVDGEQTIDMVKKVARAAAKRGLKTTMGGSVSKHTRALLANDDELRELIACVETRKCVMPVDNFVTDSGLEDALEVEGALLDLIIAHHGKVASAAERRANQIRSRL
jgi:4-hydroxy-2-oxoheptanedioate aldolase